MFTNKNSLSPLDHHLLMTSSRPGWCARPAVGRALLRSSSVAEIPLRYTPLADMYLYIYSFIHNYIYI